jgi:uncharacterized protein (TIGR02996 family)
MTTRPTDRCASLLAECVAHPEDDAPRLIWADAVDGERGELVALQCGRDALPRGELAIRNRRERALLAAHAMEWSGLEQIATRVRFRRGFVDAIEITADAFIAQGRAIGEAAPLLTAITVKGVHPTSTTREGMAEAVAKLERIVESPAFPQIRALALVDRITEHDYPWADSAARVLARTGALAQLTALGMPYGLRAAGVAALADGGPKRLERVWLRPTALRTDAWIQLGRHAPRLTELDLNANYLDFTALAHGFSNVRSLVLRDLHAGALVGLAHSELARSLERLAIEPSQRDRHLDPDVVRQLARFPALRELELRGFAQLHAEAMAVLAEHPLPALRVLRIASWGAGAELARVVARYAPQLELLDLRGASRIELPSLPCDVLVDEPTELELLHCHARERASAFVTPAVDHPGAPTKPAWLVCVNGARDGMVWDLGAFGSARIRVGRGIHGDVVLPSGSVARGHGMIMWKNGAHVIHDMGSTNGIRVDGKLSEKDIVLEDNLEIVLGSVVLRYFAGPEAGARASAHAKRIATHEPVSGLPRAARDEAGWLRIANLAQIERHHGQLAGDQVIAELGRRLVAAAGDAELSAPQRGVFRVYPREHAQRLAATCAGAVDHEGLMVELQIEARAFG